MANSLRIQEIIELCYSMGYRKIGLAFCAGLHSEARVLAHNPLGAIHCANG